MPQIAYTTNVKPHGGKSTHYDLITDHMSKQQLKEEGDLIIIPNTGRNIVTYQAVFATVSPFLSALFNQFAFGAIGQTVTLQLDLHHSTLVNILDILHSGVLNLKNTTDSDNLRTGLNMLGISLKLEISKSSKSIQHNISPGGFQFDHASSVKAGTKRKLPRDKTPQNDKIKRTKIATSNSKNVEKLREHTLFRCDKCDMTFKLRKGLNCHISRIHSKSNDSESTSNREVLKDGSIRHSKQSEITNFLSPELSKLGVPNGHKVKACYKCDKFFPSESVMLQHLACCHYSKQLSQVYPDEACPFLACQHTAQNHIVKLCHVAVHHQAALNVLMESEGLPTISMVEANNMSVSESPAFLTPSCQLCPHTTRSPESLAAHYMTQHYAGNLDTWDTSPCQVCGALFLRGSMAGRQRMLQHVALRHAGMLVEFMERDGLWVGKGDVYREAESMFQIKKMRVDMKKLNKPSIVKKLAEIKSKSNQYKRSTKKSDKKCESSIEVSTKYVELNHEPRHDKSPPSLQCFLCGVDFKESGMESFLEHMSTRHYKLEIERNYMTRPDAVWSLSNQCPFCDQKIEEWDSFIKHVGVEHRAVEQFIPEKFRFPVEIAEIKREENSHTCLLPGCTREFLNERTLLVHMVMSHYYQKLEQMFESKFIEDNSKCFKCGKNLPSNKVGFMKHMGVEHSVVLDLFKGNFDLDTFINLKMKKERMDF